jgi:hypothetical protein
MKKCPLQTCGNDFLFVLEREQSDSFSHVQYETLVCRKFSERGISQQIDVNAKRESKHKKFGMASKFLSLSPSPFTIVYQITDAGER